MEVRHVDEIGGYYMRHWAEFDEERQQWRPVASFERVADYRNSLVPGMRHNFVVWFDTKAEATAVAYEQGVRLIRDGEVGL